MQKNKYKVWDVARDTNYFLKNFLILTLLLDGVVVESADNPSSVIRHIQISVIRLSVCTDIRKWRISVKDNLGYPLNFKSGQIHSVDPNYVV